MDVVEAEISQSPPPAASNSDGTDRSAENTSLQVSNHEDGESKRHISDEEARGILEVIAATGKFWHEWDMLKSLLSFRLKQVLEEYPEFQQVSGAVPQQDTLSGETYSELLKRLDEALVSFMDGPPFTLQRVCEILLAPKSTYRSLSKLAFALEKNLLVTSTLSVCTEPYPTESVQRQVVSEKGVDRSQDHPDPVANGADTMAGDGDEEMVDADAGGEGIDSASNSDTEMVEVKAIETPQNCPEPNTLSNSSGELITTATDLDNSTTTEAPCVES